MDIQDEEKFTGRQEAGRKDVEGLFGVLKRMFQIRSQEKSSSSHAINSWGVDEVGIKLRLSCCADFHHSAQFNFSNATEWRCELICYKRLVNEVGGDD